MQGYTVYDSEVYSEVRPVVSHIVDFNSLIANITSHFNPYIKCIHSPFVIAYGEMDKLKELSTGIADLKWQLQTIPLPSDTTTVSTQEGNHFYDVLIFVLFMILSYIIVILIYQYCVVVRSYYIRDTVKLQNVQTLP